MSTKHTKGEWKPVHYTTGWEIESSNGVSIMSDRTPYPKEPKERVANAKLIAAAPKLLEAIQAMYAVYPVNGKGDREARNEATRLAFQAIKKATE